MENRDANGAAHYPGWSLPALKYLYEERKIAASGHETTDTGPGIATSKDDYSRETYILRALGLSCESVCGSALI
jgi:kynurenine formamidase